MDIEEYLVGSERLYKNSYSIVREIMYLSTDNDKEGILKYTDSMSTLGNKDTDGIHNIKLKISQFDGNKQVDKILYSESHKCLIDPSNLTEFLANSMTKKVLNAPMTVKAGEIYNITLIDPVTNHKVDVSLTPEYDGKVVIIDNTYYYYIPNSKDWFVDQNNMISKGIYNNEQIIIEDYRDNSIIVLKDKSVVMNIYKTRAFYTINGFGESKYVTYMDYVTKFISSLYYNPLKSYMPLNKTSDNMNLWYEDFTKFTNDILSYNSEERETFYGNIKNIDAFVPLGYLNLLGVLFQDNQNYRIYGRYIIEFCKPKQFSPIELRGIEVLYYYIPVNKLEEFVKAIN